MNSMGTKNGNVNPQGGPAKAAGQAKSFHFGSGRRYSVPDRQTGCVIHDARTLPTLFGRQASRLSSRLGA